MFLLLALDIEKLFHFRSTSHHQFTQEDRVMAEAQHEAMSDRCKEVSAGNEALITFIEAFVPFSGCCQ